MPEVEAAELEAVNVGLLLRNYCIGTDLSKMRQLSRPESTDHREKELQVRELNDSAQIEYEAEAVCSAGNGCLIVLLAFINYTRSGQHKPFCRFR